MRIAGVFLIIFGFIFWTLARIQLGAAFSVAAKASILVTHGLYSRIRSPIYVFGSIMIAGVCLFFLKPIWLLAFLILIPMQIARAHEEARVLEAKFGETYREYKRGTWF
jgi:protein-S-isoprenylcysteine O-methyltransferase Ste14